jgi:hypothetical protein
LAEGTRRGRKTERQSAFIYFAAFGMSGRLVSLENMNEENLQAELERLKAENESLKQAHRGGSSSLKVSEKGAVSLYGLGRFPVTLYKEQWEKLLSMGDQIKAFIEENKQRLKLKE